MTHDTALIDEIVRRVMQSLGGSTGARPDVASQTGEPTSVRIVEPVITGDLLAARVNGSGLSVAIDAAAVLTPSARDYIRGHGLHVDRVTSSVSESAATACRAIVVTTSPMLDRLLTEEQMERELANDADAAATAAISAICRGESSAVCVFTDQLHRVACLANRNASVRAAAIVDVGGVRDAIEQFDANVVCCDPRERSWFELRNFLRNASRLKPG